MAETEPPRANLAASKEYTARTTKLMATVTNRLPRILSVHPLSRPLLLVSKNGRLEAPQCIPVRFAISLGLSTWERIGCLLASSGKTKLSKNSNVWIKAWLAENDLVGRATQKFTSAHTNMQGPCVGDPAFSAVPSHHTKQYSQTRCTLILPALPVSCQMST